MLCMVLDTNDFVASLVSCANQSLFLILQELHGFLVADLACRIATLPPGVGLNDLLQSVTKVAPADALEHVLAAKVLLDFIQLDLP